MFSAFEGPPKIVRLHGRGDAFEVGDAEFDRLALHFTKLESTRSIVRVIVERIADSCGWAVPLCQHRCDQDTYVKATRGMTPEKAEEFHRTFNSKSIDGLPGFTRLKPV